jgi:hypothetical protein
MADLHVFVFFRNKQMRKRPLELQIGEYVALAYCGGSWIFSLFMALSFYLISHICVGFLSSSVRCFVCVFLYAIIMT